MTWLTKSRKPESQATMTAEPEQTRDIFEFWDGTETRRVDPLQIWYRLWQLEDIEATMQRAANNEMEAVQEVIVATRGLFDLKPLESNGLTEIEVQTLLMKYLDYASELKKKHGPLPMPWRMLAPLPPQSPSDTTSDADSSSSPSESPSVEPSTASTPSPPPSTTP